MERPLPGRVDRDIDREQLRRLDAHGVFPRVFRVIPTRVEIHPYAVKVDRVRHHGVVVEVDAKTLSIDKTQHVTLGPLEAVKAPDVSLHVACQVEVDLARWWSPIGWRF